MRLSYWLVMFVSLAMLALAAVSGRHVAARHKLWKTITKLEAEMRTLGPIVEETRSDLPALAYSEVCEVGKTKVPRLDFVHVKYQWAACVLRTTDWSAITVHDAPVEILEGVTIAVRVAANRRDTLGWWEAVLAPRSELATRVTLAIFDVAASRITRVIETPSRTIGIAIPVQDQRRRHVIIEIDGGMRMLVWQFAPGRQPLDEEFLINWALQVQFEPAKSPD